MKSLYRTRKEIILASNSPRRKELLTQAGLDFCVQVSPVDESPHGGEKASDYVLRVAKEKGVNLATENPNSWVLSADTTVAEGNTIFGKPDSPEEACEMLMSLSGREHTVSTGFCLQCRVEDVCEMHLEQTRVHFTSFNQQTAAAYAATGEPMDKAGAYGIQGIGGMLVEWIDGSYTNVIGLPMAQVLKVMLLHGVIEGRQG